MQIRRLPSYYGIYWLERGTPLHVVEDGFFSLTRTDDEISIVCRERDIEGCDRRDEGYALLRLERDLDGRELHAIMTAFALDGVRAFPLTTFEYFYILIKKEHMHKAVEAMRRCGHSIIPH